MMKLLILRQRREFANSEKGAVLLIAILVSSVALAVGFGVYNRTYKELVLASFWKQTQIAFSAADAGLECAMYWDTHPLGGALTHFPTFSVQNPAPATKPFSCFGQSIDWEIVGTPSGGIATSTFSSIVSNGYVTVEVVKGSAVASTTIRARGYNTNDTTSTRRVERGLRVDY